MKKVLILITILINLSTLYSNDKVIEISASETTDLFHPGEYAIDGHSSRGWQLDQDQFYGWLKLKLYKPLQINGIKISGDISDESRFSVGYTDKDGVIRDFFTGINRTIITDEIVDLSYDEIISDELYIRLSENSYNRSWINNIEILSEDPDIKLSKREVTELSASSNTSIYSPEHNLIDGQTGTFWRIENNLNWKKVFWGVKEFLDNRFTYNRNWIDRSQGYVEFSLDNEISKIKFYVLEGDKGLYSIEGHYSGKSDTLASNLLLEKGWNEVTFNSQLYDKINFTITSYDQNDFPSVGEFEFWGEREFKIESKTHLTPYYNPVGFTQSEDVYFTWSRGDSIPVIEAIVEKGSSKLIYVNGHKTTIREELILGNNKVISVIPDENLLFDGNNYLKIENAFGIRLREQYDNGFIKVKSDHLADGRLFTEGYENDGKLTLETKTFIDRVEVYSKDGVTPSLYAYYDFDWHELQFIKSDGYKAVYDGGIIAQELKVGYSEESITEIRVWGSPEDSKKPVIELLYPYHNMGMISHLPGYSVLVGQINNPESKITVNGIEADKYGNIFWVKMKDLKMPQYGVFPIEIIAENGTDIVSSKNLDVIIQHNGYRDSVYGPEDVITKESSITIEGNSNQWRSRLYINGLQYSIDRHNFSHPLKLEPGLNEFNIQFKDKKGSVVKQYNKRVFRETTGVNLVLSNTYNEILTRDSSIRINGFVKGFGIIKVSVNNVEADVNGFSFHSKEIPIVEGENEITITVTDQLNNRVTKVITVLKDSIAPVITDIEPQNNDIVSTTDITFYGSISDDLGVRVFLNGEIATLKSHNTFSKQFNFPDGINSIELFAIDKSGNKSETYRTQIVTDTTPPESFHITTDPSTWNVDTTPVLTFGTLDITTNIVSYEVKIDNNEWSEVTSPYEMPHQTDGSHNVAIKATDRAGHSTISSTTVYIDTIPPEAFEVTSDPAVWANNPTPEITFDTTDLTSRIVSYQLKIDNGDWISVSSPYILPEQTDGEHTITIRATDEAGLYTDAITKVFVDTVEPEAFEVTADPESWSDNTTPQVSFETVDVTSSIVKYELKVDDGEWSIVSSPYIIPEQTDGIHEIIVRATDEAGLYIDSSTSVFIDTVAPEYFEVMANPPGWSNNTTPEVSFEATDLTSNIVLYELKIDDGDWIAVNSPYIVPEQTDGEHIITVRAFDEAGHKTESVTTLYVDTVPPETFDVHANPSTWSDNKKPEIIFEAIDETSDIVSYKLKIDGGDWVSVSSPYTIPEQTDGEHIITVRATDEAGLFTDVNTTVYIDTKAPEPFDVIADPISWTSNTTPKISFNTTDMTSDIVSYQIKIDSGDWTQVYSPYIIPEQTDGAHNISVRATDEAGLYTDSSTKVFIDTIPAKDVEVFRTIPTKSSIKMEWVLSQSTDVKNYKLLRTPDWSTGSKTLSNQTTAFIDEDVERLNSYQYELIVIDKANNESNGVLSENNIVGLEVEEIEVEDGAIVEYENLSIIVPENSLPEEVSEIHLTEIQSEDLKSLAESPIIGPVYSTSIVREVDGEDIAEDHITFEKDFLASFTYDESDLPDGLPEQNIGVYYFDETWGRWFKVENSSVDTENNRIFFKTNHFTSYSIQPSLIPQMSAQDYQALAFSPNSSGHSGVIIDPQSGSATMSVKEFTLPGKAGFDFTLRRLYSSVRARQDSFNMALASYLDYELDVDEDVIDQLEDLGVTGDDSKSVSEGMIANLLLQYQNSGDYAYSMGAGWRLDLPIVSYTSSNVRVTLPGGGSYGIDQMQLKSNTVQQESDFDTDTRVMKYENHEGADFSFLVLQELTTISTTIGSSTDPFTGITEVEAELSTVYNTTNFTLILKDGTTYLFDGDGKLLKITDPKNKNNEISFFYEGYELDYIIDTFGREIHFEYSDISDRLVPLISEIKIKDIDGSDKYVEYVQDTDSYFGVLKEAYDFKRRKFTYNYQSHTLISDGEGLEVDNDKLLDNFLNPGGLNSVAEEVVGPDYVNLTNEYQAQYVDALQSVSGPGLGTISIDYDTLSQEYINTPNTDNFNGLYATEEDFSYKMLEKLIVKRLTVTGGDETLTTDYSYDYSYSSMQQFTNKKTTINDGRKKSIYYFDDYKKLRTRVMTLTEEREPTTSITRSTSLNSSPSRPTDDIGHILNYGTNYVEIPKLVKIETFDLNNKLYKTKQFNYDKNSLKLIYNKIEQSSENFIETSYEYDSWGNISYKKETSNSSDGIESRTNSTESWINYYNTSNNNTVEIPIILPEYDSNIISSSIYTYKRDLPIYSVTRNYQPTQSEVDDIFLIKGFDYDNTDEKDLRLTKSSIWTGDLENGYWINTNYTYDLDGNVDTKFVTAGSADNTLSSIDNDWDYDSSPLWFTHTKTVNGLEYIDDTTLELSDNKQAISIQSAYDFNTGLKLWDKDGKGYYTQYMYDALGRRTAVYKDDLKVEPTSRINPDSDTNLQRILYDDDNYRTEMIDVDGHSSIFQYNILNQLKSVTKEDLVTKIEYNIWGNVEEVLDPEENKTTFTYDLFGRNTSIKYPDAIYLTDGTTLMDVQKDIEYNTSTNTRIITDEEDNRTYQVYDMYNRVIETGYYDKEYPDVKISLGNIHYDGFGNPVIVEDGNGNEVVNTYNELNQLKFMHFPEETFYTEGMEHRDTPYIEYRYNDLGQKISQHSGIVNSEDIITTNFYPDILGRLIKINYPTLENQDNVTQKIIYDNNGNISKSIDGKGNLTSYSYNELNLVETITHPLEEGEAIAPITSFEYDELGNRIRMIDPRAANNNYTAGFEIDYVYDDFHRLEYAVLPRSVNQSYRNIINFDYDKNGNLVSRKEYTSSIGGSFDKSTFSPSNDLGEAFSEISYQYNTRNMLLKETIGIEDDNTIITKYEYDKRGKIKSVIDGRDVETSYSYDEIGRIENILHGSGINEQYIYDLNGNNTEIHIGTNNNIQTTKMLYNAYNRLTTLTKGDGDEQTVTSYKYDYRGNTTSFSDGIGNTYVYEYDNLNRLIIEYNSRHTEDNPIFSTYSYDSNSFLKSKIDFEGSEFSYNYTNRSLLDSVQISGKGETKNLTYEYDEAGSLKTATDDGVTTKYNYVLNENNEEVYQPDAFGAITSLTTEVGETTFDKIGYNYDNTRKLSHINYPHTIELNTDENIEYQLNMQYNSLGQLTTLGDYLTGNISYEDNGLLDSYTLANNITFNVEYESDSNRLKSFDYKDTFHVNDKTLNRYEFEYDDFNNIVTKTIDGNINEYTWDSLNQLTEAINRGNIEVDPKKLDLTQNVRTATEDYEGDKSLELYTEDTELSLDHNSMSIGFNLGSDVKLNRFIIHPELMTDRLKNAGNQLAIYYSSDNENWIMVDRDNWSFVELNDSVELSLKEPILARYIKVHCYYDIRGLDGSPNREASVIKNSPDKLVTAYFTVNSMTESFNYDDAGNRETYTVDYGTVDISTTQRYIYYENSNLIKSDGEFVYVWDKNGNLTEKSDSYDELISASPVTIHETTGNYTKYKYDLLNRLVQVDISTEGSKGNKTTIYYTYDHRGYRIKRLKNEDVTQFTFGLNGEILSKKTNDQIEHYIYMFGKHFAKEIYKSDKENIGKYEERIRLYYHTDNLGSTIAITDENGDKVWSNNYTAFGNSTNESGLIEELGIYTGKEIDPDTGLYYFNARWYDPDMGRFITEDPIKDGTNWHIYCSNNPINYIDPTGLCEGLPSYLCTCNSPDAVTTGDDTSDEILTDDLVGEDDAGDGTTISLEDIILTADDKLDQTADEIIVTDPIIPEEEITLIDKYDDGGDGGNSGGGNSGSDDSGGDDGDESTEIDSSTSNTQSIKELWNAYEYITQFEFSATNFICAEETSIYKGKAHVIFENPSSGEYRIADYILTLKYKVGVEFNLMLLSSRTTYERMVRSSEPLDRFFSSFEDAFASTGISKSLGIFNFGLLGSSSANGDNLKVDFSEDVWSGSGSWIGLGYSKGASIAYVHYELIPDSVEIFHPGTYYIDMYNNIKRIPKEAMSDK